MRTIAIPLLLTVAVFIADQWSKSSIMSMLAYGESRSVVPGVFNLTLAFNHGAAFGLWTNLSPFWRNVALLSSTGVALAAILFFMAHRSYRSLYPRSALALILGGALGNIWDRITLRVVVDFLDVYVGDYHWPAFNIADSAICVGVFLLLFYKAPQADAVVQPAGIGASAK
jgi:signal peptidase II